VSCEWCTGDRADGHAPVFPVYGFASAEDEPARCPANGSRPPMGKPSTERSGSETLGKSRRLSKCWRSALENDSMAGASRVQISEKLRQIHKDYLSNLAGGLNAFVAFIDEPSESLLAAAAYNLCGCARSEATARCRITC